MKGIPHPLIFTIALLFCCSDTDVQPGEPPVASFTTADMFDVIALRSTSIDPDSPELKYNWTSSDTTLQIIDAGSVNASIKIPEGHKQSDVLVTLSVNDGHSTSDVTNTVTIPEYSVVRAYGLGTSLDEERRDNTSYNWYMDQGVTGKHALVNCGPTVVTMAIKWFNQNFNGSPEDARNTYRPAGNWWYTADIINYLNDNHAKNFTIKLENINKVKAELDAGNILILCLDMYYVSAELKPGHHAHKFYSTPNTEWGHFLLIKGYKRVGGKIFYETYDPYSLGQKYDDGALKGLDRFYAGEDLDKASQLWWEYAIVVTKSDELSGRRGIDVAKIAHKPGR